MVWSWLHGRKEIKSRNSLLQTCIVILRKLRMFRTLYHVTMLTICHVWLRGVRCFICRENSDKEVDLKDLTKESNNESVR